MMIKFKLKAKECAFICKDGGEHNNRKFVHGVWYSREEIPGKYKSRFKEHDLKAKKENPVSVKAEKKDAGENKK